MSFIEAREVKLQTFLSNANEAYKVPLYQRTYAWSKDEWEDLFEDIKELEPGKIHFLGSIVVVPEAQHRLGVNYFQVVDGQQRLATLLIWLSAIRDIAKEKGKDQVAKYLKGYLFAKELEGDREKLIPKLQLGKLDDEAFRNILEGNIPKDKHLIFQCYEYFKKETTDESIWQNLLHNISVVHINTFNHFNAFRLFETLNDRGLELSAADLIKNFVLMKVSSDKNIFDTVIDEWTQMYEKIRDKEPLKFIRRYVLSDPNYRNISEARLYEEVSAKLGNEEPARICEFVRNLNSTSTIYKNILECSFPYDKLNKKLSELHLVEVATSFTLLLKVIPFFIEEIEKGDIHENDMLDIMEMIETFHIRWGICSQATSKLDRIYNDICRELQGKKPSAFKETIRRKFSSEIINNVDDEIFRRSFASRNFKPAEQRTKYILWKLSKPTGETLLNIREIQIEHIMPQKLSNEWIDYLLSKTSKSSKSKEEIKALHTEYLNRIGNLTIIKGNWNVNMSNRLFDAKKDHYYKSEFLITKKLREYDKWTFDEIERRTEELTNAALEIWKWKE